MADTAVAPAPKEPPTSTDDANGEKEDAKPTVNGEKEDAKPSEMEVEATDTAKRTSDDITSDEKVNDEAPVTPSKKRPKILDMELVDDDDEAEDFKPKKGQFCDVCFLPNDTGFTNLGKCKGCDLVVHSSCYEKKYLDETGHFKCDVCVAVKKGRLPKACLEATPKKGKKPRKVEDVVSSPGPLPPKIEATCDGREYAEPDPIDGSNIDVFCQLCLRRDVMGGMKPTDEGKWVHLACTMSTPDTWFDGSVVRGVTNSIKKNMRDRMKKNDGEDPTCEACGQSGGFLVQCAHLEPKKSRAKTSPKKKSPKKKKKAAPPKPPTVYRGERKTCKTWIHPLCAEICERVRIIQRTDNGDVIHYKCAEHSYIGLDTCGICGRGSRQNEMIECDGCQRGYHMSCLTPPLEEVPEGEWKCNKCLGIPDPEEKKEEPELEPEKPAQKEKSTSEWISDGLTKPDADKKDETPEAAEKEEKTDDKGTEETKEDEVQAEEKPEKTVESKETTTEPTADESEKASGTDAEKKDDEPPPEAKDDAPPAEEEPKADVEETKESTEIQQ